MIFNEIGKVYLSGITNSNYVIIPKNIQINQLFVFKMTITNAKLILTKKIIKL